MMNGSLLLSMLAPEQTRSIPHEIYASNYCDISADEVAKLNTYLWKNKK